MLSPELPNITMPSALTTKSPRRYSPVPRYDVDHTATNAIEVSERLEGRQWRTRAYGRKRHGSFSGVGARPLR